MSSVKQVIESIEKLHGDEREQAAKHRAYLDFQRQQKQEKPRER